jgi:hypothetical protein
MAKQAQQRAEHEDQQAASERRPAGFTIKKYNAVVQGAKLLDIRMTSSRFEAKSDYFLLREREKNENKSLMTLGMEDELSKCTYVRDEGLMFGELSWHAYSKAGKKRILYVKSDYLVVYSSGTDLEERYVEAFLRNVGKFATFPYFRALVATYSAASSADLPILPVLKQPIDAGPDEETVEEAVAGDR